MTAFDVLVVGGNGRVGGSTVRWLDRLSRRTSHGTPPLRVAIGGRSAASFDAAKMRLDLDDLLFVPLDLDGDREALSAAISESELVVHTAGPFQGRSDPHLLSACIAAGVPYCDVCDELAHSRHARALAAEAAAAEVPAVVSCGIWPGVSALMAARAVEKLGGASSCDRVELSFFTAGTGGAGPTIVSATFLLLATAVTSFKDGLLTIKQPWTEHHVVDFGAGVGEQPCFLLDNPDVFAIVETLGVASCESRFGTAPRVWNTLFGAMKALPADLLRNPRAMQSFAQFSMPIIRAVDALVGSTNAMRVDAYRRCDDRNETTEKVILRCVHPDLENCVGLATAAFALEILRGRMGDVSDKPTIAPGVWFPTELQSDARNNILRLAKEETLVWEMGEDD